MCECFICGRTLPNNAKETNDGYCAYNCPNCGSFIIPDSTRMSDDEKPNKEYDKAKLTKYMYYNKKVLRIYYIGDENSYGIYKQRKKNSTAICITADMLENWYPKTFDDKINKMLIKLQGLTKFDGDVISKDLIKQIAFISSNPNTADKELDYIIKYLLENGYLQKINADYQLTPKSLERIYELQKNDCMNKNIFVAMTFHQNEKEIREAIKQGIIEAGYSPILMDEIIHNHQIIPEMLQLIKESCLLIMDITQPNYGAYFEAGYALGLNKEVIISCQQEVWDTKDFSCEKDNTCPYKQLALKPHFDIAQKQILLWQNHKDLTKKITKWIKRITG